MRFEEVKLQDVADYVKERMPINEVLTETYVSTENLLPNKSGKTFASAIPNAKTVIKYQKNDVLISNIRPYFKKIWFSNTDGGASSDVLVIRANEKVEASYLYYFLSQDKIFDYMVQTSRGTKMPRGDKDALMKYPVFIPDLNEQRKVSYLLSNIDQKININNSTISSLEQLAQTLFKRWFVDFEFPNEEGKPYKSSGGKMVESELGMIPVGWEVGSLSDIGEIVGGGTPSKKHQEYYCDEGFSWITPKDLSKNKSIFQIKGEIDITELGLKKSSAKLLPTGTVLFSSRAPIGYVAITSKELSTNQGFKSVVPKEDYSSGYVYCLLKYLTPTIELNAGGSTFKEISATGMKKIETILPSKKLLVNFGCIIASVFQNIKHYESENLSLSNLRDTLLPKLLSGEIELPDDLEVGEDV